MSEVALLRQVSVLADLSDELLGRLAADAGHVRLKAGEWLFREGERAEILYVLVGEASSFAIGLTRTMGARLAASRAPVHAPPSPHTVAVIGLEPAVAVDEVADLLAAALRDHGTVAHLRPEPERSPADMVALVDRAEGIGLLEFHQLDVARESGRAAAREALEAGAHELA
jgi:hypothetical protein